MQTQRALPILALGMFFIPPAAARPQTATGALSVQLTNSSALVMVFNSDASGVALGNTGTSAVTLGFGTVADYKVPSAGVTETSGSSTFTVSSPFDVYVEMGGSSSTSYSLAAALAATAPTGLSVKLDSTTLSTTAQTFSTNGTYFSNVPHTVSFVLSTAASGSGGPATGTQLTSTIDLTATAN